MKRKMKELEKEINPDDLTDSKRKILSETPLTKEEISLGY